jgi:Integrase zinc binding domain/Integrase core domain
MNQDLYYDLVKYLGDEVIREEADEWRRRLLLSARREFELEDGLLYKKRKNERLLVIPKNKITDILELAHDHHLSGHMGAANTYFRLKQNHWWPGMEQDIKDYVKQCDTCQKRKTKKDQDLASSAKITPKPFDHIGIDVMGPLPRTLTGKRYIIIAIDFFTKWPEAVAVEEADAQAVVKFLHQDIICRHGVPSQITSDRGTEFLNDLVTEFERTYRIKHIKTTAYHPQGNGQTERTNQTIKNILSKICKSYDAWDHYLESALFAARTIRQKSTMFSPAELVYGRLLKKEYEVQGRDLGDYEDRIWKHVTDDIDRLQRVRRKASEFISKAQERQRKKQNETSKAEKLQIGDEILIYRNITESSWSAKLEPKWEGPYLVHEIKGQSIFLRHPDGHLILNTIHRNRVKKYHGKKLSL